MIEQGLVMYIQQGLANRSPALVAPVFYDQLTKDALSPAAPMAWRYQSISSAPSFVLNGQSGWTDWNVQIDCHGYTGANAIQLAAAIKKVLRPIFAGALPDPDQTYVFGIYREPQMVDGFSDVSRTFVRSLEFVVQYNQV